MKLPELLAPAGSFAALTAAINAGADAVYFGVAELNMRSNTAQKFTLDDLDEIAEQCHSAKVKCYLALNVLIYQNEIEQLKATIDAVKQANIDAVICFDPSVIEYARSQGVEVHMSTQHSISNVEAVKFFSKWADRMVLARELTLEQIREIVDQIQEQDIKGPAGRLIEIEIFIHGAMCVSVSGRCGMSLYCHNTSANRGKCLQPCRRAYQVTDPETGKTLKIDNEFVMSPEDLCTIGLLDEIVDSGAVCLKIEGRGRAADYVDRVVTTYREALDSIASDSYTKEKIDQWNKELGTVYNRGLSDGFYRGKAFSYWCGSYGSQATETKEFVGPVTKYYSKIQVAEIKVQASDLEQGTEVVFLGDRTGSYRTKAENLVVDEQQVDQAKQGDELTFKVDKPVRRTDKMYKIIKK
ncbi:MAG: peptidase U32 family protein [Candidatus Uhrbacteria bacterium]